MFLLINCVLFVVVYKVLTSGNHGHLSEINSPRLEHGLKNMDSTGNEFEGEITRHYTGKRTQFSNFVFAQNTNTSLCEYWGVMTTIFSPSEAVRRFLYLNRWCLVIVGDQQSPPEYKVLSSRLRNHRLFFLNPEEQNKFSPTISRALPWKSFGRKNIGYLFAISKGAKVIWDFDDDNYLKFWLEGASPDPYGFLDSHITHSRLKNISISLAMCGETTLFFNPYQYLGSTVANAWPRGFPISHVHQNSKCAIKTNTVRTDTIGILQSLADHQPDVDAVFRMTVQDKFYFDSSKVQGMSDNSRHMLLSQGLYSPTNAQATLYFAKAFATLYLPVSVPGRVSDIWRSYIGQGVLSLYGIYTGFIRRALVDQNRNKHSFEADFQAEIDLYTKTKSLVYSINNWVKENRDKTTKNNFSIQHLITDLYIFLYERNFVEIDDVSNIQTWLSALNFNSDSSLQNPVVTIQTGGSLISDGKSINIAKCGSNAPRSLKFWTSDLHDGCRLDIPTTLDFLGHRTIIGGIKKNQTPYPEALKKKNIHIYSGQLPAAVRSYTTHSTAITEDMITDNAIFFNSYSAFKQVDAVFCSFPASMCQLWFPFNKTKSIFFLPAHRYNLGRCTVESWSFLNKQLKELANENDKAGYRKHVIGAVSRYDLEYLRHYTGLNDIVLIPSFSGFYTDPYEYKPVKEDILLVSQEIPNYIKSIKRVKIVHFRDKYQNYLLSDVVSHPALVFLPYSVMSFKFTEFYSLNVPLFVPSPKLFLESGGLGPDRTSTSPPYCDVDASLSIKMPKSPQSYHFYNPNLEFKDSKDDEMYWLQFSDFYELPHVIFFDNGTDLEEKLQMTDFASVHQYMKIENKIRKHRVIEKWCDILQTLEISEV